MRVAVAAVLCCACGSRDPDPPAPAPLIAAPAPPPAPIGGADTRIDTRPLLDPDLVAVSVAVDEAFGARTARSCGVIDIDPAPDVVRRARDCLRDALAAKHPFVIEQRMHGTDSGIERALVGLIEDGTFTTYSLDYDSDPCGGGCAARGGTSLARCTLEPEPDCRPDSVIDCFACRGLHVTDSWHLGKARLAGDPAEIVWQLAGATPASPGRWLAGVRIGATAAASEAALRDANAAAAPAGVTIEGDDDGHDLLGVRANIAGRCSAIATRLAAAWGAASDGRKPYGRGGDAEIDRWIDRATHARVQLDREHCTLSFDRYVDPAAWISQAADAVVPLSAIGKPASVLSGRAAVVRQDDNPRLGSMSWRVAGIGVAGAPCRMDADIDGDQVRALHVACEHADPASYPELRAQLDSVLGKPAREDADGATWSRPRTVEARRFGTQIELDVR
jgi:hypothetical protein